jgi:hypothetical protein
VKGTKAGSRPGNPVVGCCTRLMVARDCEGEGFGKRCRGRKSGESVLWAGFDIFILGSEMIFCSPCRDVG